MADDQETNDGPASGGILRSIGAVFGWILALLEPARQFAVNIGVLIGLAFGGPAVYKMATKPNFVLRDISVPAPLSGRGFTGDVVAYQILDHIAEIDREAGSKKEKAEISGFETNRSMPAINLPVGGLSLASVVSELRTLMGTSETKVTGEIYIADTGDAAKAGVPHYGLRLRIAGQGPIYRSEQPSPTLEPLIEAAAQQIMRRYDPINLGYYHYRKKHYRRALALTDEVLAGGVADDMPWAYTMRGLIARDQGQYADAAAELREAIILAPKFALGHVTLASVLRLDGRIDDAEASARKAIELSPNQHDGHGMLALILLDRGQQQDALAEMRKGVEVDGRNANAHLDHGRMLARLGRHEEALTAFKTAAALKPAAEPLFEAAKASKDLKRDADALAHLRRATQVEPKNPQAWLALGEAQLERSQHSRAVQSFAKGVALDTETPTSLLRAARALDAAKRAADADYLFTHANAKIARHPALLLGWSEHAWVNGRKAEATTKLKDALTSEAIGAPHLETAGRLLEARNENAEASAVYRRAIALDPRRERTLRPLIERLSAPAAASAPAAPVPASTPIAPATTPSPIPAAPEPVADKPVLLQQPTPVAKQPAPKPPVAAAPSVAAPSDAAAQPWATVQTPAQPRAPKRPRSEPAGASQQGG